MNIFYGEDSRQRLLGEEAIASSLRGELSRRRAPLFDSADEAASLGFVACARELRAGQTLFVKCGSAVVEYGGSSPAAIAELRSGLCLAHVAHRLASNDAFRVGGETARMLVDLEWFAEVDKRSLFAIANHGVAKMELHLSLFEPPASGNADADAENRRLTNAIVAQLRREKKTTVNLVAAIDDTSGTSLAGVVARACARVFEWDDQRLLALYSSPKRPFILQLVGEEFHEQYRSFFRTTAGKIAFPQQQSFETTDGSNEHVRKYLSRVRGSSSCKRIEVFFPAVPILAAYSNGDNVLYQCRNVIEQVVSRHRRDDIDTPRLVNLERDVLLNLEDESGSQRAASKRYAYLHQFTFQKGDGARLVEVVRRAPRLSFINLDFSTGLDVDTVRSLLALDHVCAVSLLGSDVAAAVARTVVQSDKLLCDYAWRNACRTLAPLDDDVRRKRYLYACLSTVRFEAENLLADRSVQTT
jgi:hypothetical protein